MTDRLKEISDRLIDRDFYSKKVISDIIFLLTRCEKQQAVVDAASELVEHGAGYFSPGGYQKIIKALAALEKE